MVCGHHGIGLLRHRENTHHVLTRIVVQIMNMTTIIIYSKPMTQSSPTIKWSGDCSSQRVTVRTYASVWQPCALVQCPVDTSSLMPSSLLVTRRWTDMLEARCCITNTSPSHHRHLLTSISAFSYLDFFSFFNLFTTLLLCCVLSAVFLLVLCAYSKFWIE